MKTESKQLTNLIPLLYYTYIYIYDVLAKNNNYVICAHILCVFYILIEQLNLHIIIISKIFLAHSSNWNKTLKKNLYIVSE